MGIFDPKLVLLDTATTSSIIAEPRNAEVQELRAILWSGTWVPYITWYLIEELLTHANDQVVKARLDFIASLPHVAYLKTRDDGPDIGSSVEVRDHEIAFIFDHSKASPDDVIQGVGRNIRSGFCTGHALFAKNAVWWRYFRKFLAKQNFRHKAEVVNITHFPITPGNRRLPKEKKVNSPEKSAQHFARMATILEKQIALNGDCRGIDPHVAAFNIMREAYEETLPALTAGGDFVDAMLKVDGVERHRMPNNPTVNDMCYESVFVGQMDVHARRLRKSKDELLRLVRKEQIPAWVIWQEIDHRVKQFPKAEIGNLNDKYILTFGPYVDVLNVDKRIAELLRQASKTHPLLKKVYERVPEKRGLKGLLERLRKA